MTLLDFFLAELVKPLEFLAYENRLAMSFKRLGEAYLENAAIEVGNTPDYCSNRNLFNCKIVMTALVIDSMLTNYRHYCFYAESFASGRCSSEVPFAEWLLQGFALCDGSDED